MRNKTKLGYEYDHAVIANFKENQTGRELMKMIKDIVHKEKLCSPDIIKLLKRLSEKQFIAAFGLSDGHYEKRRA